MTTSTLPANSLFEHVSLDAPGRTTPTDAYQTSFSSRAYSARPINNKLYGSNELAPSGTSFGHNIWQSNWQADLEKNFDHVVKDKGIFPRPRKDGLLNFPAGNRRPQPPSLALPNIKAGGQLFGNGIDRRSPIGSERGNRRESEPHSARSRSQHESSSLTPTSFSNDSELSTQLTTLSQDQRRANDPFSAGPTRERNGIWPNAPEFQPSLSIQQQDLIRNRAREQPRYGLTTAGKIQPQNPPEYGFGSIWNTREKDEVTQERNEFRPALLTSTSLGSSDHYERNFLPVNNGLHELNTSFARLTTGGETRQNNFTYTEPQNSATGRTRFPTTNPQDRPRAFQDVSDPWTEKSYMYNQNLQHASFKPSQPNIEIPRLSAVNGPDGSSFSHYKMLQRNMQSPYQDNSSQVSNVQYRYQTNDFRPVEAQLHASQMYDTNFFSADANAVSVTEYKGYNYGPDPTISDPYMMYNQTAQTQPEANQVIRSALLEEFRIHGRTKKYELKDIFGHIVEFSGDQLGSRFIQHKLEVANSEEKDRVFNEIARDCRQLMTDLFGNYVIQKLFEHGNQSQKKILASHMKGHMMALSTQTYGCRVVQKALDHILTEQQASLIKELDGYVLKVVENQNGNHVIQKAIECIPGEHIQFIVDAHRGHVHALSKHAYGCRVIQRMLEHCQPAAKRLILDELHMNIGDLIQDPFGNYVVQHVIVNGEPQDRRPVIEKVQAKLLENAMHKFASNVVEKALDYAEEDQSRMILQKLTSRDEQGQSQIAKLLSHQYGNYVVRKYAMLPIYCDMLTRR